MNADIDYYNTSETKDENHKFEVVKDAENVCVKTKAGKYVFQEKMLDNNIIHGIIAPVRTNENGIEYFNYYVTGLKSVTSAMGKNAYNYLTISKLIKDLVRILLCAGEYLLEEDDFVIDLDRMFLSLPDYGLKLLYLPGFGKNMMGQLSLLFENMMNRLDYGEERAVDFVYKLYGKLREDVSLSSLTKEIDEMISIYDNALVERQLKAEEGPIEELPLSPNAILSKGKTPLIDEESLTDEKSSEDEEEEQSYFSWLKKKLALAQHDSENSKKVGIKENKNKEKEKEKEKDDKVVEMVVNPKAEATAERTIVVHTRRKEMLKLVSLQGKDDILVENYPFYIGSVQKYANGVIKGGNVSRIHAKFDKKKGIIYLTDLNSTNGTFVNGQELVPDNEVALCVGDVIAFADTEYEALVQ
ncbi:MAG: FHA domain-containing protein [Lachnospiraceae bacterium]|nr:FHA domain-containing protein [Lachnospiraceae bacterium]